MKMKTRDIAILAILLGGGIYLYKRHKKKQAMLAGAMSMDEVGEEATDDLGGGGGGFGGGLGITDPAGGATADTGDSTTIINTEVKTESQPVPTLTKVEKPRLMNSEPLAVVKGGSTGTTTQKKTGGQIARIEQEALKVRKVGTKNIDPKILAELEAVKRKRAEYEREKALAASKAKASSIEQLKQKQALMQKQAAMKKLAAMKARVKQPAFSGESAYLDFDGDTDFAMNDF